MHRLPGLSTNMIVAHAGAAANAAAPKINAKSLFKVLSFHNDK